MDGAVVGHDLERVRRRRCWLGGSTLSWPVAGSRLAPDGQPAAGVPQGFATGVGGGERPLKLCSGDGR